jgi:hypothetical protein
VLTILAVTAITELMEANMAEIGKYTDGGEPLDVHILKHLTQHPASRGSLRPQTSPLSRGRALRGPTVTTLALIAN